MGWPADGKIAEQQVLDRSVMMGDSGTDAAGRESSTGTHPTSEDDEWLWTKSRGRRPNVVAVIIASPSAWSSSSVAASAGNVTKHRASAG